MSELLFFPMSMPNETLHSRITRYHYLSGNKTEPETFRDLFDAAPFPLIILPKQIETLATRLPGEAESNLSELIETNTILPAYKPFLGISDTAVQGAGAGLLSQVVRVPRREGASQGKAKICLSCVQQDFMELGSAYWHRSHQLPGVTACWRHGDALIHCCSNCSHPFYRANKLLPDLTGQCICGWSPLSAPAELLVSEHERHYAIFAHEILQRNLPFVNWSVLAACYRRQGRKRGFAHGELMGTAKLADSIQSKYGDEVLSRIDKAYAAGKRHQWIRFTTTRGQIDMPLARHLLIAQHLFGDADGFEKCLAKEMMLAGVHKLAPHTKTRRLPPSKNHQFRQKIEMLMETRSDIGMEYLWANAYQATRWLAENDKSWLAAKLAAVEEPSDTVESSRDPRDERYAALIQSCIDELYLVKKSQKRANIGNILGLLPAAVRMTTAKRKEKFPLVSHQLELHFESLWHFRLRRAVWAVAEMARLGLPPNNSSARLLSTLPSQAWSAIVNFFEWELEKMTAEIVDVESLLKSTGVSRQWAGPPGYDMPMGGHAYLGINAQAPRSLTP